MKELAVSANLACRRPARPGIDGARGKPGVADRIAGLDPVSFEHSLEQEGFAVIAGLLSAEECLWLTAAYDQEHRFRSRVVMARHGFGRGEYKYLAYPLPELVGSLREALYPPLSRIANRWNEQMTIRTRYPREHAAYLARCHRAGQRKPTPLLLRYGEGDYNCLHRDLYGEHVFPLQATVLLSAPRAEFTGGEFVLTEQRPRMQSRTLVVPLDRGDGVIFPVYQRPVRGTRGYFRVGLRHGVSTVRSGRRYTLGIIFHDAR
jgi:hypothetical protein